MDASDVVEMALRGVICIAFCIVCIACAKRTSILGCFGLAAAALLDIAQAVGFPIAWQYGPAAYGSEEWFAFRRASHLVSIGCNFATAALIVGSLVMLRVARDPAPPPDGP